MHNKPKVLVVGSFVMDLIVSTDRFPDSGETVIGLDFKTAPGGKGANQAVQAARLGAKVAMAGKVGKDDFGVKILKSVSESGVDVTRVALSDQKPTAIGNVQLEVTEQQTSNRILVVPGANMDITCSDIAFLKDTISQLDMVLLQLEIPMEINVEVARIAHDNGVPVMLNSAPAAPLSDELLSLLTYISPNEHEAAILTGIPVKEEFIFISKSCSMGNRGAAFGNENEFLLSPCFDYGKVVDPTAAGDSFVGAFCTAVCIGASHEDALRFANATAAITVSRMGAQPSLPVIDDVLEFMEKQCLDIEIFKTLK